jgi:hypothetical protein
MLLLVELNAGGCTFGFLEKVEGAKIMLCVALRATVIRSPFKAPYRKVTAHAKLAQNRCTQLSYHRFDLYCFDFVIDFSYQLSCILGSTFQQLPREHVRLLTDDSKLCLWSWLIMHYMAEAMSYV